MEKRFEGVEECMICFYVLHGATYQLPKLQCRTCKKRYHSACLVRRFQFEFNKITNTNYFLVQMVQHKQQCHLSFMPKFVLIKFFC